MTGLPFEPQTEGHWCVACESFRVRSAGTKCPTCADDEAHPERATRKPPQ